MLAEFLSICEENAARNLRTLPIDLLQIEQGKAQNLHDFFSLCDMANEVNIKQLMNTQ
ncbi:TPA: hypothetical protein ACRZZI_004967 [Vibrio harveyi]